MTVKYYSPTQSSMIDMSCNPAGEEGWSCRGVETLVERPRGEGPCHVSSYSRVFDFARSAPDRWRDITGRIPEDQSRYALERAGKQWRLTYDPGPGRTEKARTWDSAAKGSMACAQMEFGRKPSSPFAY